MLKSQSLSTHRILPVQLSMESDINMGHSQPGCAVSMDQMS